MDKYEVFTIGQHITMVQRAHQDLMGKKTRTTRLSKIIQMSSELSMLKHSLMNRLSKMDRTTVDFFPPGALVEFVHPNYSQKEKYGVVEKHDDGMCLCKFDEDNFSVKVDPIHLKLRFIRNTHK